MGIWAWVQPDKRIWKVVTDHENGTICVYDEDGNLLFEKSDLSTEALDTVEENFLDITATNLNDKIPDNRQKKNDKPSEYDINPMYL